jgi:alkaline phosphatase D
MSIEFRHAVASFEPTETSVLLWTRLSGGATSAELVVAADPGFDVVVTRRGVVTDRERDHTIVVDVDGLDPATTYWYRFSVGDVHSPVGRTRTLPAAPVERFRLGLVCCARYSVAPLGVYRALAEREVDLVLHLGDYIYEDDGAKGARRHRPPRTAVTLDDYRERLAQIREDPDAQALHLRHPMTTIWDDHDLSDNAWRDGAKHHDPRRHGPWAARVAAAARARQEWLPARLRDPNDSLVTWRSMVVGDLAEFLLLDTRLTGRDRQAGDGVGPGLHDPARSLLGDAQREWLRGRVLDTSRQWAVVASGVVVNEIELPLPRPMSRVNALLPNGYAIIDDRVLHDDQWDGYPAERARLAAWMSERALANGRTIVLSGDVHSSWAFVGPCDTSGAPVAVEFTVPAVSSAAMGRAHYPGLWRVLDRAADDMDHVVWADVTERGYALLELTPGAARVEWWFAHPYDQDPAANAVPAAAFVTLRSSWPPQLEPADGAIVDLPRPGLPAPLPCRPANLGELRMRRRLRLAGEISGAVAAATGPLVVGQIVRRRRRRR